MNKQDARTTEKYLKSGMGKGYLKNRLKRFLSLTGLTFLEIVVSLILFTITLVGFLQAYTKGLDVTYRANRKLIATNLADALMAEIKEKDFHEDGGDPSTLGPEAGETRLGLAPNNNFDDVDDYRGWNESPPVNLENLDMDGTNDTPNCSDFTRSADVYYCEDQGGGVYGPTGNGGTVPSPVKCIDITVSAPYLADVELTDAK